MSDVTVACGLCDSEMLYDRQKGRYLCPVCFTPDLGRLIDQFEIARAELSNALDVPVYDLSDHREESWNGDPKHPQWGEFVDEWEYDGHAWGKPFQRGNLTFISLRLNGGETTLAVFSNDKIEDHEEC